MKSISLTGKKWILKNFDNNYSNYIKENYYLDEITSKLLAIRKIHKNEIKLFINPSIKICCQIQIFLKIWIRPL